MTTPSSSEASTASAVASARAPRAFLPPTGSVSGPTEMTSAPSSCRRITVTQYSRSSKPSATRTATFFPSSLTATPLVSPSLVCRGSQQVVDFASCILAPEFEGAGQGGHGVGSAPGPEQPAGGVQLLSVAVFRGGSLGRRVFAVDQGEDLLPVAGGAAESDAFYGAEFIHRLGFAGGDLLQVRVMQDDVRGHLLPPCLLPPPAPQPLEEVRVHIGTVFTGRREPGERGHEVRPLGDGGPCWFLDLAEADVAS